MLLSKCEVCDNKKSKFLNEQKASGLLSSLGVIAHLSKISWVGLLLLSYYKMNEIANKVSLAGDNLMPWNAFKTTWVCI